MGWEAAGEGGCGVSAGMEGGGEGREVPRRIRSRGWSRCFRTMTVQEYRRVYMMERVLNESVQSKMFRNGMVREEYMRWRTRRDGEWICEFRHCNSGALDREGLVECNVGTSILWGTCFELYVHCGCAIECNEQHGYVWCIVMSQGTRVT